MNLEKENHLKSDYAKLVSRTTLAISLLLAAAFLAGCGGSQDLEGATVVTVVELEEQAASLEAATMPDGTEHD